MRLMDPSTPPTTGAAVSRGFEDIPPPAADSVELGAAETAVSGGIDIARD